MEPAAPPPPLGIEKPRLTDRNRADRGKGGHRPKPRMNQGLHKNAWVKTYYICPVPKCKWSGSSRTRHARSRPECSAVPIAFRYQPGADVGKMVQVALSNPAVLTSASQEAAAATGVRHRSASQEETRAHYSLTGPPPQRPATDPPTEPLVRSAVVGRVSSQAPVAPAAAASSHTVARIEGAERLLLQEQAQANEGTVSVAAVEQPATMAAAAAVNGAVHAAANAAAVASATATTETAAMSMHAPTQALMHTPAVPTGVPADVPPGVQARLLVEVPTGVPTGVPAGGLPAGGVPTGMPAGVPTGMPAGGVPAGVPQATQLPMVPLGLPEALPRVPIGAPTLPPAAVELPNPAAPTHVP